MMSIVDADTGTRIRADRNVTLGRTVEAMIGLEDCSFGV